jgi:hypothetical protein
LYITVKTGSSVGRHGVAEVNQEAGAARSKRKKEKPLSLLIGRNDV